MKTVHVSNRGQVLIIFVFAIIGLVGITGLAIDGSNIYSDRRHAQNAADTAAMAAALHRVTLEKGPPGASVADCGNIPPAPPYGPCASEVITTALDMARTNGYSGNPADGNHVEVHTPPIDGYYKTCTGSCHPNDYVQVIISTNVDTFFARVLGIAQTHNRVEAVALAKYVPEHSLYGGNSLVALNPHSTSCYGDVYFGGSGIVTLNKGGVFVNSDNSTCAFKETNTCPTVNLNGGATIQGVGGQFPGCSYPVMAHPKPPLDYPPDAPFPVGPSFPPPECNMIPPLPTLDGAGFSHYYPGHYAMLPPDKNTVLEPGVFCVDNVVKTTNPTTLKNDPSGDGTFIYIKPGGSFNFQGGTVNLTAPKSGMFRGYLIYVDESDSNWYSTAPNCTINGSADTVFNGVIYAPHCDVTINGGSTPVGFTAQIISFTLSLEGSANLTFTYDANLVPPVPEINWTGLFH